MRKNPLIVALDVESTDEARGLVSKLGSAVNFYKVGMELYAAAGMAMVRDLQSQGKDVFLDLKFYDIPETVKRAVTQVAKTGVQFLTVHGSASIMRAAVDGKGASNLKLLAVTVLTSFGPEDMEEMGYGGAIAQLVERRARKAADCGIDGLVASALETAALRKLVGPDMVLVTPGVRSAGADRDDQKRVTTPAEAIRNGADYLVIGRQITRARDPRTEAERILQEIAQEIAAA